MALAAARRCAVQLAGVAAVVVYRGQQGARAEARWAMANELALAKRDGAPAVPTLEALATAKADRKTAARAGKAYARRWLQLAIEAIEHAEAERRDKAG